MLPRSEVQGRGCEAPRRRSEAPARGSEGPGQILENKPQLEPLVGANLVLNESRNRSQDPPQDLKISRSNIDVENDQTFIQNSQILGIIFDVVLNRFASRFCFVVDISGCSKSYQTNCVFEFVL